MKMSLHDSKHWCGMHCICDIRHQKQGTCVMLSVPVGVVKLSPDTKSLACPPGSYPLRNSSLSYMHTFTILFITAQSVSFSTCTVVATLSANTIMFTSTIIIVTFKSIYRQKYVVSYNLLCYIMYQCSVQSSTVHSHCHSNSYMILLYCYSVPGNHQCLHCTH